MYVCERKEILALLSCSSLLILHALLLLVLPRSYFTHLRQPHVILVFLKLKEAMLSCNRGPVVLYTPRDRYSINVSSPPNIYDV